MSLEIYVTANGFFKWSEFLVSRQHPDLAAQMSLSELERSQIRLWVQMCGDPLRLAHPDNQVIIHSGKRSKELNAAVGGAKSSQHLQATAVDFELLNKTPEYTFCWMMDHYVPYRQLICYPKRGFIHHGWNVPGKSYKRQSIIQEG